MSIKTDDSIEAYKDLICPVENPFPVVMQSAYDCFLIDLDERKYLDFGAGLAVNLLGYSNDEIKQAVKNAADTLIHCGTEHINLPNIELARYLKTFSDFDCFFFSNSGSEANEAAIKLARKYHSVIGNKKKRLVSFSGSFHGRSILNISIAGNPKHCDGFEPLVANITHAEFNNPESLLESIGEDVCAVIVETIQCRGGLREISKDFVTLINQLRKKYKFLTIVDEVQTGTYRVGSLFSHPEYALDVDIVTLGKGIGGGFPIGVTATTKKIGQHLSLGSHGNTFGGGPLVSSVALTVLKIISSSEFSEKVEESKEYMKANLVAFETAYKDDIANIVSCGMLFGFCLIGCSAGRAAELEKIAFKNGLIIRTSGDNAIRLTPPLCITRSHIDSAFTILYSSMKELISIYSV